MFERVYRSLPITFQNFAVSLYGAYWKRRRFGGVFKKELEGFKRREFFEPDQWETYQIKKLRELLLHSNNEVPFYRNCFMELGLKESHLKQFNLDDLRNLPLLTKEHLRTEGSKGLLANTREPGGTFFSSSGSTGKPVKILFSNRMHQRWSAAFEARIRNWAHVDNKDARAMVGGRIISPDHNPPFYRYNSSEKQVYFSIYDLSPKNIESYYEGFLKYRPTYLTGYATSVYNMALFFKEAGFDMPKLKSVITSSEKLTVKMRSDLSTWFNCSVYDSYSGIEACGLISEKDGTLFSSPDVGILELLDKNGQPVKEGQEGEMVWTGLINFDQPLIRYRIGDLAIQASRENGAGGVNMPMVREIVGRTDDVLEMSDGKRISSFNRFFADIEGIQAAQVIQSSTDTILVRFIKSDDLQKFSLESMKRAFDERLGEVNISFEEVDHIQPESNGKVKSVISNLNH